MKAEHNNELPPAAGVADMDSARRRAFLAKMGKGTAALAALAPLSSRAGGTHKLANFSLPGGFGYCTVSGYQSAAVSGAPATICSAFAPSYFLTTQSLTYSALTSPAAPNATKLAAALSTKFGVSITAANVSSTLLANPIRNLVVTGTNLVIYAASSSAGVSLQPRNFPGTLTNSLAGFNSAGLFTNSSDSRTLLEVLYDGVLSSSPATAKCYFLSAYLTVFNSTPLNLPLGFNKTYVTGQYSDGDAASGTDAYQFFKTLCGA
jgi:hypothetical protein